MLMNRSAFRPDKNTATSLFLERDGPRHPGQAVGKSGRTLAKPVTLSKKNSMKRKFLQILSGQVAAVGLGEYP